MAATLSVHQAGHEVVLFERYPHARPAGNILNLWPPPIKALGLLGVNTEDPGAPCTAEFRNARGRRRVRAALPERVVRDYGGGFIGLCAPSCTGDCSTRCPRESCRSTTRWSASSRTRAVFDCTSRTDESTRRTS
ncbi:hypothetical protein QBA54_26710 [Streptomyces sp. B21-108]|uniref:hypothetical protein n=1 Tax=Streptomyces sp. B21-108 TaxID=3039419 RepID=UPI002FF18C15